MRECSCGETCNEFFANFPLSWLIWACFGALSHVLDALMLLSTLRHCVESMGGKLELVAHFPNRPPVVIDHLGFEKSSRDLGSSRTGRTRSARVVA